jgi:hypothetical protein
MSPDFVLPSCAKELFERARLTLWRGKTHCTSKELDEIKRQM